MTHVVDQCGVKLQSDKMAAICHMAATSYRRYLQATPVLRRVKQAGAKLAQCGRACRASCDVTLSGTFIVLCQPLELGMIAMFAI